MLQKRYPLRVVYVARSPDDRTAFKQHVAGHDQIVKVFEVRIKFISGLSELKAWLNGKDEQELRAIDIVFFDTDTIYDALVRDFMALLAKHGVEANRIIAIADSADASSVWAELKGRLGSTHVYGREDALTSGGWEPLNKEIEAIVSRRVEEVGGDESVSYALAKVEGRHELVQERISELREDIEKLAVEMDERLEAIAGEVKVLSQVIFQGPHTQQPAIVTEIVELKRVCAALDTSIGNLAEVNKNRSRKHEQRVNALERKVNEQSAASQQFSNERNMLVLKYKWQIGLALVGTTFAVFADIVSDGSLRDVLSALLGFFAGGGN